LAAAEPAAGAREAIARWFTRAEDVVYVGLGVVLAASAVALLVHAIITLASSAVAGTLDARVVELLDRVLLTLIFVEVLSTVQVSFREHTLVPEPFLVVGVIAGTRRVLVLTAEIGELLEGGGERFLNSMIELGLLTVMIVALVAALVLLRKRAPRAAIDKS
jgi:phosphate starvation-inducible membrane PsiE